MEHILNDYIIFLLKFFTIIFGLMLILRASKGDLDMPLKIKSLSKKYKDEKKLLEKTFKIKSKKSSLKKSKKNNLFVLNFNGDMRASAVEGLRREITSLLPIVQKNDQVMIKLESPGGTIIDYGLAHAQLRRLRDKNIKLTVCVDRVAASGGYLMACVANDIIAAPFAYIGSIGVAMEMVNFHGLLKKHNVETEVITSKKFKRTLTPLSKSTNEARAKVRDELSVHQKQFENAITRYRPKLDMSKVATGEYWCAENAIEIGLVDSLGTSDEFLLNQVDHFNIYEIQHHKSKTLKEKLFAKAKAYVGL